MNPKPRPTSHSSGRRDSVSVMALCSGLLVCFRPPPLNSSVLRYLIMGLDAKVYCNCFETGRLKELPPEPALAYVCLDGSLNCKSEDLEALLEFDEWLRGRACEHENGVLLHHRIGNIALIGLLREELKREAAKFPVLLEKVLYNGVHAGDHLSLDVVLKLQSELQELAEFAVSDKRSQGFVEEFEKQMQGMIDAALSVRKPISF